ncbi:MAG: glycosyltransferase family 2 protein [Kiritimatiellia bacterium]
MVEHRSFGVQAVRLELVRFRDGRGRIDENRFVVPRHGEGQARDVVHPARNRENGDRQQAQKHVGKPGHGVGRVWGSFEKGEHTGRGASVQRKCAVIPGLMGGRISGREGGMQWVLAISIALLAYVYAGYPALIGLWARFRPRPVRKGPFAGGVAVLIAAHDEAGTLPRKLEQLLELAQAEPIREIWIGLDGCTDGTGERVRDRLETLDQRLETGNQWQGGGDPSLQSPPRIQILEFESRRGKAAVLNDLMARATQPILVLMDARQRVEAGAISRLLENFADEQVGAVSGELVYEAADGAAQKGAESYWGYEKFIRQSESRTWAVPGATGALYAIRRDLCEPIPENTLVDDVLIPMRAVLQGYRCLFEPAARVFDLPSARFGQEGLRKRRTLAGIWQLAVLEPRFFSFRANPIAFQWYSHKFLRLLTPFFVLAGLFSLVGMSFEGQKAAQGWLGAAGIAILASFLAFLGGKRVKSRILGLFGAFFGVNWALLQAAGDAARGRYVARWQKSDPGHDSRTAG